jgi:hypothetical protein
MLAMVRNDSRVHQAELKKKKKKERKGKKWAVFPFLGTAPARLLICSLARSLALFSVSFPIALMSCTKEYPYALCHTHTHSIIDMMMMRVAWF